ncbi:MAG TPA: hypothetical protein DIS98_09280 [Colwellia sp.]|nr:hypothetical protein [Colwellia sp.]|tara:strand:- start:1243 stop:2097 length:855 start_codon:yes stop_codon:yes gene_type:complete
MFVSIKVLGKDVKESTGKRVQSGFTLMELIIVIIIMGVMSVGIAGFIKLSTQTYVNVTERDELLANARFAVERLNREVRNAVPNSMRVRSNGIIRCLEFVPIITSTIYTEIPVAPETAVNTLTVIPFQLPNTTNHVVIVYPLNSAEVYQSHNVSSGKAFLISEYPESTTVDGLDIMKLANAVQFNEDSPTNRAYIFNTPVSYCLNGSTLIRYVGYDFNASQLLPPFFVNGSNSLMAENIDFSSSSFTVFQASLRRNAVIQIKLNFTRDGEEMIFDNAIHIINIP